DDSSAGLGLAGCSRTEQRPIRSNIARGGKVIQSSLYENEVPERAIDGNRASNLGQRSCSVTNNNLKPWWRLDLLKTHQINTVTITNRGDCCPERINGAEIRIGNSLHDNGNENQRGGKVTQSSLYENEVPERAIDGNRLNIARGGIAAQSSLYENEVPERAIDGSRASHLQQGSCSATNNNLKPWWRLDLLKTHQINTVTITNRGDCCHERLNGAE
ncbi:hypothetical protein FQN60_007307, partial [Etheostoma spectabile]